MEQLIQKAADAMVKRGFIVHRVPGAQEARELVLSLIPQGASVGLGGSNFSGGQGQCISIARAMLRDAQYLLLDEATSNLDVVSGAMVTQAMDKLREGRTTILIAHNYAATRNADYVIVMKEGTVKAAGTPEEPRETNEYYKMFSKTL